MSTTRKLYPSDVTDVEWEFLLPYLTLMREDAPQREYTMRDLFNAMRYVVKTGCQWRYLPHDFPILWGVAFLGSYDQGESSILLGAAQLLYGIFALILLIRNGAEFSRCRV